jgi:3-oxoacyl-ACP reductase-like protein
MKMLPSRVVPVELPKRGRPKKIQSEKLAPSFHQVAPAIVKQVAQVAPVASTSASDTPTVAVANATNVGTDSLILKLTDKLKMKIDQIDNETKLLLKLLL